MSQNLGTIYYTVEADTGDVISSGRELEGALDKVDSSLNSTDRSAKDLNIRINVLSHSIKKANRDVSDNASQWSSLTRIMGVYLSMRTVSSIIEMSDKFGQMSSRIKNTADTIDEYEKIQSRLLETANGTYRALSEAQEVYLATESSLKRLGYTTDEVLDISDSLSYAFVRDAARADQATNAMDAYSKSLMKGKVEADGWASIMAAAPSLVEGIAKATGRTAGEITKLGATGKLSVEALNEGLRQSRDENKAFADEMEVAVSDSTLKLRNALSLFIGKVNESSGASRILTDNISDLADILQDPETIKAAQELAGAVVAALNKIITTTKEVVNFARWMGEEIAAAWNGAASDDIVRLEQHLEVFQEMLNNPLKRLRGDPLNGFKIFSEEEIKQAIANNKALIAQYYKDLESQRKPPPVTDPVTTTTGKPPKKVNAEVVETGKLTEAQKAAKKAAAELAKQQEQNTAILAGLSDALDVAALKGEELAVAKAKLRLNDYATDDEVSTVEGLARALWRQAEAQKAVDKFGKDKDSAEEYINGSRTALSGGAFDNQYARYAEEEELEIKRYQGQQKRLEEARKHGVETNKTYDAIEQENARIHAARMQQIEQAKNSMLLTAGEQAFSSMASAIEAYSGRANNTYRTLFATAKGFAIALAAVNLTSAISQAMADPSATTPAAKMANMAAIAAAGGNLASEIASVSYGGGRRYGGAVDASKMYRVNENGRPEMFNATNGQQYFLPNTSGSVAPAGGSGGGVPVQNNIYITVDSEGTNVSGGDGESGQDAMAIAQGLRAAILDEIERQSRVGGAIWRATNG